MHMMKTIALALCLTGYGIAQQPAAKHTSAPAAPAKTANASTEKPGSANMPSEQTVNEFLQHQFGYMDNLKWKVSEIKPAADPALSEVDVVVNTPEGQQAMKIYVTPDLKHAVTGDVIPFGADPFAPARETLDKRVNGPARGAANPDVTIVEFGDLQCPSCKKAQANIEKLMTEVPTAKLVFQQFPLVQVHKWAMIAAKYGECVAKQNKDAFWKYVDTVYQHQDEMQQLTEEQAAPKLKGYAAEAGVNADQAEQCTQDPAMAAKIFDSTKLGQDMEVTGTPTLFVGGRKISNVNGIPYEQLKGITEFHRKK
jgi:protein-disulfide isomerase